MAAPTKAQIQYLRNRIEEASDAYITREQQKLGDKPEVLKWSPEEMLKFIRDGVATLKNDAEVWNDLEDAFSYPQTGDMLTRQANRDAWEVANSAIYKKVEARTQQLMDELMLGRSGLDIVAKIEAAFA